MWSLIKPGLVASKLRDAPASTPTALSLQAHAATYVCLPHQTLGVEIWSQVPVIVQQEL